MAEKNMERLNKYLAACGVCSRRDADKLIGEGRVTVNGKAAVIGSMVCGSDTITVNGKTIGEKNKKVVLAYYKQVGVTCTQRDKYAEKKISDQLKFPVRLTYAGRLDKDSEGLIIMTNDGMLIDAMMRGANRHEKEYVVRVDKEISQGFLEAMARGVRLEELSITTRPCEVRKLGKYTFNIILTQGVNRQIRRMSKTLGYEVKEIKRTRVMNIELASLKPGEYRRLQGEELQQLYEACGM
jgi:23S rRNA pseudouridine2604 synthase